MLYYVVQKSKLARVLVRIKLGDLDRRAFSPMLGFGWGPWDRHLCYRGMYGAGASDESTF